MSTQVIRVFGDPVLKRPTAEVTDIDGALVKLVDTMYDTMYDAPGVGLAAPQVGVQRRFFVYDVGDGSGPHVIFNPQVVEARGEAAYEEGCLSIPGIYCEIVRPKIVTVEGIDIHGNPVTVTGDDLLGRVFLHEIDHLDGVLMTDRLEGETRKAVMRQLREQAITGQITRDPKHVL